MGTPTLDKRGVPCTCRAARAARCCPRGSGDPGGPDREVLTRRSRCAARAAGRGPPGLLASQPLQVRGSRPAPPARQVPAHSQFGHKCEPGRFSSKQRLSSLGPEKRNPGEPEDEAAPRVGSSEEGESAGVLGRQEQVLLTGEDGRARGRRLPVARRDRIVVSTLRCGRSNLGSNPSHGNSLSFSNSRRRPRRPSPPVQPPGCVCVCFCASLPNHSQAPQSCWPWLEVPRRNGGNKNKPRNLFLLHSRE
ncbi:uncharacterized protein LOC117802249 [Ailuropoda melanoleuca]|uniref:uncharacterized protein LOC117802249 n=1 Tax=Ailuropoda melanoleuca TaxID=9646 RepID=UPI0014949E86|nr:uncharacterized protein LOC117802249 [Ailuropoda melanoleuca]